VTFQGDAKPDATYEWDDFKTADLICKHDLVDISYLDVAVTQVAVINRIDANQFEANRVSSGA
jgi:hypothetical protein